MTPRDLTLWISVLAIAILGGMVYTTNPRRTVNQHYVTTTAFILGWMLCLAYGFQAETGKQGAFWIRQASAVGSCIALAFNMLRLSLIHPQDGYWRIIGRMRWWCIGHIAIIYLCQTTFFMRGATLPSTPNAVAEPIYGPGFTIYALYMLGSHAIIWSLYLRDMKRSRGMRRAELQYILLACFSFLLIGGLAAIFIPWITGTSQSVQFSFLNAILLEGVIAYGIATRRILSMAVLFRMITAYTLLLIYLTVLYLGIFAVSALLTENILIAHLLAALVTAFSMAPAHTLLQRVARRLFIHHQAIDTQYTVQEATEVLQSITTIPRLLMSFTDIIRKAVGTNRAFVLLRDRMEFFPVNAGAHEPVLSSADALVEAVQVENMLIRDQLERSTVLSSAQTQQVIERLDELELELVFGIRIRNELAGILCLGPRVSGRFYSRTEQEALGLLCTQLAVSMENAQLYTLAQNSRIYNEILLDRLLSGVIAVDPDGNITVFNREAEQVLSQSSQEALHNPYLLLPEALSRQIEQTMKTGEVTRDVELWLPRNGHVQGVPIRLSCTPVASHDGTMRGALLVFHDLTAIKRLEFQVQHNDRLASIGRLSAGMAHEIKNPLVTLKTFTQLLPDCYQDEDFRNTFTKLVGSEVERIDSTVRQLLQFARPPAPTLRQLHLHTILADAVHMIRFQAENESISIEAKLEAEYDLIRADNDQCKQAILNLLLNAIEAMKARGSITVLTDTCGSNDLPLPAAKPDQPRWIRLMVTDSGCGIAPDVINTIFDPFYTTKASGTGLGLSVVHGIIKEHDGQLDVSSTPGVGTTFYVYLPLLEEETP